MKKTLSAILVAVMLLSTLVCLVVPASAADNDKNMWKVMHAAFYEETIKEEPDNNSVPPLAGYKYTENGFETISPNYTNYGPRFSVVSQEKYSLDDFTMTVEIKDYSNAGDNWFSFTVWDRCNGFAQGFNTGEYGYGWSSLVRDADGNCQFDTFLEYDMSKSKFNDSGAFNLVGSAANFCPAPEADATSINCTMTFAIKDGKISVNGVALSEASNAVLAKQFKDGLAYIGITLYNSDSTGKHSPTVTITDVNGEKPQGDISAEPENKQKVYGEMRDSSTVPANTPAILFDASFENEGSTAANKAKPGVGDCSIGYSADNKNFLITAEASTHYFSFSVKDEITYNANDFRMVAFLFKNLCTCELGEDETACEACGENENIKLRYCAGEVQAPNNDWIIDMYPVNVNAHDENGNVVNKDEHYIIAYAYIDNEEYTGRIHGMRLDINDYLDYAVEGKNQYEIVWGASFAGGLDLLNYVANGGYEITSLAENLVLDGHVDPDDIPDIDIDLPGDTTSAPTDTTTEEITTVTETEGTTTNAEGTTAEAEETVGCGSVVSMGAIAIVTVVAGIGIVTFKKKKED